MKVVLKNVTLIVFLLFSFSPDAPKSELWRSTYKQCFLECVKAWGNDRGRRCRHWCNIRCVYFADKKVRGRCINRSNVR